MIDTNAFPSHILTIGERAEIDEVDGLDRVRPTIWIVSDPWVILLLLRSDGRRRRKRC